MVATFLARAGVARMTARCRSRAGEVSAVWLRSTAQLRGRARATVLLAVLVGLAGGMVLAAVAGARRTDAALPRFLAYDRPRADAIIYSPSGGQQRREVRVLAALPEVARATRISTTIVASPDPAYPTGLRRTAGFLALDPGGSWMFGRPIVSPAGSRTSGEPTRQWSTKSWPPADTLP
jgi:hypothetical protein